MFVLYLKDFFQRRSNIGEYYTTIRIDFNGTDTEEKKFKRLVALMNKDEDYEEEDFEELPIEMDDVVQTALLGLLEDRGEDSDHDCRYFPDFDLTLAPKLFAALFPDASFSFEARWEYSAGGGETIFLRITIIKFFPFASVRQRTILKNSTKIFRLSMKMEK